MSVSLFRYLLDFLQWLCMKRQVFWKLKKSLEKSFSRKLGILIEVRKKLRNNYILKDLHLKMFYMEVYTRVKSSKICLSISTEYKVLILSALWWYSFLIRVRYRYQLATWRYFSRVRYIDTFCSIRVASKQEITSYVYTEGNIKSHRLLLSTARIISPQLYRHRHITIIPRT